GKVLRNFVRQTFDLDFARDHFQQPALLLDSWRLAMCEHRNGNADALGQIDALQVDVQQIAPDRAVLPVDDHHRCVLTASNVQTEDGVVSGFAMQDLRNMARVDRHGHWISVSAIYDARDHTLAPHTTRFILAAGGAWLRSDRNIRFHCISSTGVQVRNIPSLLGRRELPAASQPKNRLTWVDCP